VSSVTLTSVAEADVAEALKWYAQESPALALDFLRCVEAALAGIGRAPATFRSRPGGWRKALLPRFPYAVFFRWPVPGERPVVIRVLHTRRDAPPLLRG
jgi:plasmid stabilization system protein ParE